MSKQIVFIDPTVKDQHVLLQDIDPAIEIVHLLGGQDGLQQIADHMTRRWEIDAIHIVCHGAPGALQLGSATIDRANLKHYFVELAHVGRAMRESGDILLYGCEVGSGEPGAALTEGIAKLTGTAVATSTTPVGHSQLGGAWDLDRQTANINTPIPFDQKARAEFRQVLPIEPDHLVNTTTDGVQPNQQIVTLSGGGYAIVWNSELTAEAFFQLYDSSGNAIDSEILVGSGGFLPHALALNNGNFMVAYGGQVTVFDSGGTTVGTSSFNTGGDWERFVPGSNGSFAAVYSISQPGNPARDIVVQLFTETGDQILAPVLVNQTTNGGVIEPVIAQIPNTNEYFVVSETLAADGARSIHAQRVNDAGELVGAEIAVLSPENLPLSRDLHIATTSDGRVVVGYINQYTGGLDGNIYEADGGLVSEFHFGGGDFDITKQLLTSLTGGGFIVTAYGITDNGDYFVKAGIYDSNGILIGTTFDANSSALTSQSQHSATALSSGGFIVTWTTNAAVGAGNALYGQQFDATGNKVGDQFLINSTTNVEATYGLTALANDGFAVTWDTQGDVYKKSYPIATDQEAIVGTPLADQTAATEQSWSFVIPDSSFINLDPGDSLKYSATLADGSPLPTWLTFDGVSKQFLGTPPIGNFDIKVTATDITGQTTDDIFHLTVAEGNSPQNADADKTISLAEDSGNTPLAIGIPTDANGDPLVISVTNLPNSSIGTVYLADGITPVVNGDALTATELTGLIFRPELNKNGSAGTFSYAVTDGQGGSATQTVTIQVTPVNDAPVISSNGGENLALTYTENSIAAITTITVSDTDSTPAAFSYSLSGDDASRLSISGTGVLTFKDPPNFESPTDYDSNNVYDVTVLVSDNAGGTDTQNVSITIADMVETILGSALDDDLVGTQGNDIILGLAGHDRLEGGGGDDVLNGGEGIDTAVYTSLIGPVGVNVNLLTGVATGNDGTDTLSGIERVDGSNVDDFISGDNGSNDLVGFGGNDVLVGGGGSDALRGVDGEDNLHGGDGDDDLDGGRGFDRLYGGDGNDVLQSYDAGDFFRRRFE